MTLQTLDRAETKSGFISGVASSPAVDSYGHSVRAGAFDHSIRTRGLTGPSSIKLLQGHAGLPIGRITKLYTIRDELRIEAELNLELQSARDLHSIIKHSGGLNYSVGFKVEEFELDEKAKPPNEPWLIIKKGDLHEISVVTFGACPTAAMDMAKSLRPAHERARGEWEALLSKVRLDNFRVERKLDELRVAMRKARERQAFECVDWEGLRLRDPQARLRAKYNL
jgi:HK97 family phage prohead protease